MKLLLFGARGRVGWELRRALAPFGKVIAVDRGSVAHGADFTRPADVAATIRALRPQVVVNAAAFTDMDAAEGDDADRAHRVNAEAPAAIAGEVARLDGWLVHFSTDCVFDGSGDAPRDERAPTAPLSVYGRTKLAGEQAIAASGCRHLVLRTSWVFAARGENFATAILAQARGHGRLRVVDDQVGAPTGAELLADATAHALRAALSKPEVSGLYHVTSGGQTSRHGYAEQVLELARARGFDVKVPHGGIEAIATPAYPTAAPRPLNSRLDTRRFRDTFGLHLPDWRVGVERLMDELAERGSIA